jgi:hypothetical protein
LDRRDTVPAPPFSTAVNKTVLRTLTYGIVGRWEDDYPIPNGKVPVEKYLWTPTTASVEA